VKSVDSQRKMVFLSNFHYLHRTKEKRMNVRVTPRNEIAVTIYKDGFGRLFASVIDISVDGLSLLIDERAISQADFMTSNDKVRLSFRIPDMEETSQYTFNFPAKIVYSNPRSKDNHYRIGMKIFPSVAETSLLRQYIFDRQTEIIKEVS
jgi:hypothetical protein